MKKEQRKVICFEVDNFEQVDDADPDALSRIEEQLASVGALPARVDFPERVFCVTVENPNLTIQEMLTIFAQFGFRVRVKGD